MVSWKGFKQWLRLERQEQELRSFAVGMNSTVDVTRDLHVLFLDYDLEDISLVRESVKELQAFWNLSTCEIFKTKHGFHAFFFYDIMPYGRVRQVIEFARYVDPMFRYISRFYDHKTIRVAGKYAFRDIQFVEKIHSGRAPEDWERELGGMKRAEHALLRDTEVAHG